MTKSVTIPDSERLSFTLMGEGHAQQLWELDQDSEVMRYINGGKPHSIQTIHEVCLPRMASYTNPEKGWGIWQVSLKETGEYLGWTLVRPMHFFDQARDDCDLELGWRFFQHAWRKGYATEAAKALMKALHQQTGIVTFSAIADVENTASTNIMLKLGMHFIKQAIHKDPLGDAEVVYYQVQL